MLASPFDRVSLNLQKLGALTINQYLETISARHASKSAASEPEDASTRSGTLPTTDVIATTLPEEISVMEPSGSAEDERVLQIEQSCAGKTTPRWILYTNREVEIDPVLRYGAALHLSSTVPHISEVYSTDTLFPTEAEAKIACATLALSQGILSVIQHPKHVLSSPVSLNDRSPTALTLQAFFESLPRPFPDDVGDKTAAEINAPTWINVTVSNSGSTRLKPTFHWQTDPTCGLVGCLLRLSHPKNTSNITKAYIVSPRFLKRADAKAAVCLLAMSQDIRAYLRAAAADTGLDMPRMKRLASLIHTTLGIERTRLRLGGQFLRWMFESQSNAHGCTLIVNIGKLAPHERRYVVAPQFRSKADAKAAVACLAAEQGVVEFMRFRGDVPPADYTPFWEQVQETEKNGGEAMVAGGKRKREGDGDGDDEEGEGREDKEDCAKSNKDTGKKKGKEKEMDQEDGGNSKLSKKEKQKLKRKRARGRKLEEGEIAGDTIPLPPPGKKALSGGVTLGKPNLDTPIPGSSRNPDPVSAVPTSTPGSMTFGGPQLTGYPFKSSAPLPNFTRHKGPPPARDNHNATADPDQGSRNTIRRQSYFDVFLEACAGRSTTTSLLSICKAAHQWILPILYHTITLLNAQQITLFYATHNLPGELQHRLLLIKNIWIGDTPHQTGDLQYGSSSWPITILDRILRLCTNLQSLYIIRLDQNCWYRLEGAIPASLESLAMGPVHGPFHINDLSSRPRLRRFTSYHTYMRDDEVRDVVMYPHMRQFRRLWQAEVVREDNAEVWAAGQEACVCQSDTLEEMMLVVCGRPMEDAALERMRKVVRDVTRGDKRVVVLASEAEDGLELLYLEFLEERRVYIASLTHST